MKVGSECPFTEQGRLSEQAGTQRVGKSLISQPDGGLSASHFFLSSLLSPQMPFDSVGEEIQVRRNYHVSITIPEIVYRS